MPYWLSLALLIGETVAAAAPERVRRHLAVFLEAHARELDELAEALVQE